ncbi:MAG: DUF1636 domain-containing protein [Pseudomonadota bacterium]
MTASSDHFLLICSRCQGKELAIALGDALAPRLPPGFTIRSVDCMAGCDHPISVGFQAIGKAQYLFGDIDHQGDVDALSAFAQQYKRSVDGWTNATDRPSALLDKTLARLPRLCSESQA